MSSSVVEVALTGKSRTIDDGDGGDIYVQEDIERLTLCDRDCAKINPATVRKTTVIAEIEKQNTKNNY